MADRGTYRGIYAALLDDPEFQKLPERAKFLFVALKTTRFNNLASIYILDEGGIVTLSTQTSIPNKDVKQALQILSESHWIEYEYPIVWLRNGLRFEPSIKMNNPNHKKAVEKILVGLPKLAIVHNFCDYYKLEYPFESHSIPPPIKETDKEKDTDSEKEKKKGRRKQKSPLATDARTYWETQYQKQTGFPFEGVKADYIAIADLMTKMDLDEFKQLTNWIITTPDKWFNEHRTPRELRRSLNEIRLKLNDPKSTAARVSTNKYDGVTTK
jgi:hypothetical protein